MKNFRLFLLLSLVFSTASFLFSQDISINFPDVNFRQAVWEWLGNSGEPTSFTVQDIQNKLQGYSDNLTLCQKNITDLAGIDYFQGLEILDCSYNNIEVIPELPSSIIDLRCKSNQLQVLPVLPPNLLVLHCNKNSIINLPELPQTLIEINCSENSISDLPELPQSLKILNCGINKIFHLPELPMNLSDLTCSQNSISELPELPQSLSELSCFSNRLYSLPILPDRLSYLYCGQNRLTLLPELPENLNILNCGTNRLTSLPELPQNLYYLHCDNNQIRNLPQLPHNLAYLDCYDNLLLNLPELPANLRRLYCYSNQITIMPSLPPKLSELVCWENRLALLPDLPESLTSLSCYRNQLTMLPELPPNIKTLSCAENYLNVFSGPLYEMINNLVPSAKLTPQFRWNSNKSYIFNQNDEFQLLPEMIDKETSTDGISWRKWGYATTWNSFNLSSSDDSIASIDSLGNIQINSIGSCVIEIGYMDIDSEYTKVNIPITIIYETGTPPDLTIPPDITKEATALLTPVDIGQASTNDSPDVIISNDSPQLFPLGKTFVTWIARDSKGNEIREAQLITIEDTTTPILTIPAEVTIEASGPKTPVNIGQARAEDIFDVAITNDSPAEFPYGITMVIWNAVDTSGNGAIGTQTVRVTDSVSPVIIPPKDLIIEATAINTPVDPGHATADDFFDVSISNNAPTTFPLGTSIVTWTATDIAGNQSQATQNIIIEDTTPPVLTTPQNRVVESMNDMIAINIGQARASDIFDVVITNNAPESFPIGTTLVTWKATDSSGNSTVKTQEITIVYTPDISSDFTDINFRQAVWEWLGYTGEVKAFSAEDIRRRLKQNLPSTLDVSSRNISDLSGLEYFQGLTRFSCYENSISSIPELPDSLNYFICAKNQLLILPSLPPNLIGLYCRENMLTILPELPSTLTQLECSGNELTNLPFLPQNLTEIHCQRNQITAITQLPENLVKLHCEGNKLTIITELPNSLTYLYCYGNQLTNLPVLPENLLGLYCDGNFIVSLPELPPSLHSLDCDNNHLTTLPELPPKLSRFYVHRNYINVLSGPYAEFFSNLEINSLSYIRQMRWYSEETLSFKEGSEVQLSTLILEKQYYSDEIGWIGGSSAKTNWADFILLSSDNSIASLTPDGTLKTHNPGSCMLTFYFKGIKAELTTVNIPLTVEKLDITPPILSLPPDITVEASSILNVVNIGQASASDESAVTISNNAPKTFPLGTTLVTWTAIDEALNQTQGIQRITVQDTIPPKLSVPRNQTIEATSDYTVVDLGQASATDIFDITITHNAPDVFPIGETIITWTATDEAGNQSTAEQRINLRDTVSPLLNIPENILLDIKSAPVAVDIGQATASDLFEVTITNNAPLAYPFGTTSVIWTAIDANGNKTIKTQLVVIHSQDISMDFPDEIFRQAVWEWLGNTGQAENFTQQMIQIRIKNGHDELKLDRLDIEDLSGIDYFQGLKSFICSKSKIVSLPELPSSLEKIDCQANNLTSLSSLNQGLISLQCRANNLKALPELPPSLVFLYCDYNQLEELPVLPDSLKELDVTHNLFKALPELPINLKTLSCDYNQLTKLPPLPPNLGLLYCRNNKITALPDLPQSLIALNCSYNQLVDLPDLPAKLTGLSCSANQITNLKPLPINLSDLNCSHNLIVELPDLPKNIETLECDFNQLVKLPDLPQTLYLLSCDNNQLKRLPNLPTRLTRLFCSKNRLTDLPLLPSSLIYIYCDDNLLTALGEIPISTRYLNCKNNYINIFSGIYLDTIEESNITTSDVTPQYRWYSSGKLIYNQEMKIELNIPSIIDQQRTTNGTNWFSTSVQARCEDFIFLTSDSSIASIEPDGTLKTYTAGNCNIIAYFQGINSEYTTVLIPLKVEPKDTTPPTLIIPEDIVTEATDILTIITIGQASAFDESEVTITNDAPKAYELGTILVTWKASDIFGNQTTAIQSITIQDTTPPLLTIPQDITIEATGIKTQVDLGEASAVDIFKVILINNAPDMFSIGTHYVLWTAQDANGNTTTAVQTIKVLPALGDVNSDFKINIVDALLVAQTYVGLPVISFFQESADINNDGKINIVDALLIARYYVGLNDELG